MTSILFGVAVIPAQTARLFEALLEFQEERRRNIQSKDDKSRRSSSHDHDVYETELQKLTRQRIQKDGLLLDPRIQCQSCGARCHHVDALYCYMCGEKLI